MIASQRKIVSDAERFASDTTCSAQQINCQGRNWFKQRWLAAFMFALSAMGCSVSTAPHDGPTPQTLTEFESQLDRLRAGLAIPGMSAIVMIHDTVVWEGSLGVADVSSGLHVTPATQFHLASLTKTFASTIVLQLVDQGLVKLDDPVSDYGINLPSPGVIRVRHLLSHTSEGVPGEEFRYNGDRFALLDHVIERATGESFAQRVTQQIVGPLGLNQTAPNPLNVVAFSATAKQASTYITAMATGYGIDSKKHPVAVAYPALFSSAAGLVSTAREVARYSTALDAGQFLKPATRVLAYTPARGAGNKILPYGLGWFISDVSGHTLVWHYGYWTGNSSLIIKEPARGLTFVALTNSDQLSAPFKLGTGDLMSSTVAQLFVNAFVTGSLAR
jgi:CubicO group peptidase (beta-lactamase class C family)